MKNKIGVFQDVKAKKSVGIELDRLVSSRALVMASSGGGKSYLLRKLIETLYGQIQIIVLDAEGEFSSMRKDYDFVVAGKGGDIAASPHLAATLARRCLDLKFNLIADLYELPKHDVRGQDRVQFVKNFLDALVDAPKELWHPVLIILDEAHEFAPESGKSSSLEAVAALASRGRKRGFCLIAATQRMSKFHKDVAAELQNKLIGLANMDIDRKRAADELGFANKAEVLSLRDLGPGQFYTVGPAFSEKGVVLVDVDEPATRPAKTGKAMSLTPAPTAKIKAMLSQLADLPKEAEQELKDVQALKEKVKGLELALKMQAAVKHIPPQPKIDEKALEKIRAEIQKIGLKKFKDEMIKMKSSLNNFISDHYADAMTRLGIESVDLKVTAAPFDMNIKPVNKNPDNFMKRFSDGMPEVTKVMSINYEIGEGVEKVLGKCERAILSVLALRPGHPFSKSMVAARSGYSHTSSSFKNCVSKLVTLRYVGRQGSGLYLESNAPIQGLVMPQLNTIQDWIPKLGKCEKEIVQMMLFAPQNVWSKEDVAHKTGYSVTSSSFKNSLSHLATLGLIVRISVGIQINPELL